MASHRLFEVHLQEEEEDSRGTDSERRSQTPPTKREVPEKKIPARCKCGKFLCALQKPANYFTNLTAISWQKQSRRQCAADVWCEVENGLTGLMGNRRGAIGLDPDRGHS